MSRRKYFTTEDFIEEVQSRHKTPWDFSKTVFTGLENKLIVTCPLHGDKELNANNLLAGRAGCIDCSSIRKSYEKIEAHRTKVLAKFGDKFNYHRFFLNEDNDILVEFTCEKHGTFIKRSTTHYTSKFGCGRCAIEVNAFNNTDHDKYVPRRWYVTDDRIKCKIHSRWVDRAVCDDSGKCSTCDVIAGDNKQTFLKRAHSAHGDRFDYTNVRFLKYTDYIDIQCPEHGTFKQSVKVHLKGHSCPECSFAKAGLLKRKWNLEHFLNTATNIWGDRWCYDKSEPELYTQKITITCKEHGDFQQNVSDHTAGKLGCLECRAEVYSKNYYENYEYTNLYLLRVTTDEEDFVKIGISKNIKNRIHEMKWDIKSDADIHVIRSIFGKSKELCKLEAAIHNSPLHTKYIPKVNFGGLTECYHTSELEKFKSCFDNATKKMEVSVSIDINKPTICVFDCDTLLFEAANAGETTWRVYRTPEGEEVCRFPSVRDAKEWLKECEFVDADMRFGYEGDVSELIRHTEYEIKDVDKCYKAFEKGLARILKETGCTEMRAYIGKKTGMKVFRYDIATIHEYKKGRGDTRKPHHLEAVRKFARGLPTVKTTAGNIETDDRVVEVAEKLGKKAVLAFQDKDALQARGCYVYHIDKHLKPVWSNPKLVGRIGKRDDGSTKMLGYLSLFYQMMKGDKQVDGIVGLPKYGDKKAYELLKGFDGQTLNSLKDVVKVVLTEYYKVYGSEHTYPHWDGSGDVTKTYKEIFEENLLLLYMRRFKEDSARQIMDIVDVIDIEEQQNEEALL